MSNQATKHAKGDTYEVLQPIGFGRYRTVGLTGDIEATFDSTAKVLFRNTRSGYVRNRAGEEIDPNTGGKAAAVAPDGKPWM